MRVVELQSRFVDSDRKALGEILREQALVTLDELNVALAARKQGQLLGQALLELGVITTRELNEALSIQFGIPTIDLQNQPISPELVRIVPEEIARRHFVMPVRVEDGALVMAMTSSPTAALLEEMSAVTPRSVRPCLALPEDIEAAINRLYGGASEIQRPPVRSGHKALGQILKEQALISQDELNLALIAQKQGQLLGQALLEVGAISARDLNQALSIQFGIPTIDLQNEPISPEAVRIVPEEIARRHRVMPVRVEDGALVMAMTGPPSTILLEQMSAITARTLKPCLAPPEDIESAINRLYRSTGEIERQISRIATGPTLDGPRVSSQLVASAPVVRAIDLILEQAVTDRASDVHFESLQDGLKVRYRIDGILHDLMTLPAGAHAPMLSRLKIMAGMNIAERRRPQDGQFSLRVGDREIDVRMATIDSANGEMAVLRILDKSMSVMQVAELGMAPDPLRDFERMLRSPHGAILCAGPTGAGKTTTLYAALNSLNQTDYKIITVEDPIEYHFEDISQIQVNRQADITFATGLRAIMRLDPDVVLVGEIRDQETAEIATQAALTGHLVLSSVHANESVGALFRMIDLGVNPYLLSSALLGVVSQRLVRTICPRCRVEDDTAPPSPDSFGPGIVLPDSPFYRGGGCPFCAHTGYRGRTAVFEVLSLNEDLQALLLKGASHNEVRHKAREGGLVPMLQDALVKAGSGVTSLQEVIRTVAIL